MDTSLLRQSAYNHDLTSDETESSSRLAKKPYHPILAENGLLRHLVSYAAAWAGSASECRAPGKEL